MQIKQLPLIICATLAAVIAVAQPPHQSGAGTVSPADRDTTPIAPIVPKADRAQKGKVFLERADVLKADQMLGDFSILVGNVEFRKGDMFMYCDSANLYDNTNSLKAFGNVRMEQGDTLFVYADELDYDGETELAVLYADPGKKVRLINRDVTLETDVFNYDMAIDLGYYDVWGTLTDERNKLVSREGEYNPNTKDANFYVKVVLESVSEQGDTLYIYSDTLSYNTDTHIALLTCPSRIVNSDGIIYTRNGEFDTNTNIGNLYERSTVVTNRGNTITGDTLYYDRALGYGEAFGHMVLTDSVRQSAIEGDYGFYNELSDSAFVTGHARALEYSRSDTLYMHGDTIRSFVLPDSSHIMIANPRVRIYRVDLQGICDSLTYLERDSILYMNHHPVVWTGSRQIFGNVIQVHLNDSTVDWAKLPDYGFMAEHIDEDFYNQLTGKEMIATMENGELRHLDVNGSVEGILLPQENDSTYNKITNITSSFLSAEFRGDSIERAVLWPETNGTVTPLYLAKRSLFKLPQFQWYEVMRPSSPDDVLRIPPEMELLFSQPDPFKSSPVPAPAAPRPAPMPAADTEDEAGNDQSSDEQSDGNDDAGRSDTEQPQE